MDKTELKALNAKELNQNENKLVCCIKKRHILTIYAFFGFLFAYALRANLSIAIVDMVKVNTINNDTISNINNEWSPKLQGYILSSFFYGYIITQLPAGNFLI
jgi:ACS family sodium-dependent inorganic phosphate cotransporter